MLYSIRHCSIGIYVSFSEYKTSPFKKSSRSLSSKLLQHHSSSASPSRLFFTASGCHLLAVAIRGRPTWAVPVACYGSITPRHYGLSQLHIRHRDLPDCARLPVAVAPPLVNCNRGRVCRTGVRLLLLSYRILSVFSVAMAVVCGYEIWTGRAPAAQCAVSLLPGLAPLPEYFLWKHFINHGHEIQGSTTPVWNTVFGKSPVA